MELKEKREKTIKLIKQATVKLKDVMVCRDQFTKLMSDLEPEEQRELEEDKDLMSARKSFNELLKDF